MRPTLGATYSGKSGATYSGCDREDRHGFKGAYKAFVEAFRAACDVLVKMEWESEFPEGGLPPLWELKAAA